MKVQLTPESSFWAGPAPRNSEPPKEEDGFWRDLYEDVREYLMHVDQEKIHDAGRLIKSVGGGLKGAWTQIRDIPRRVFDLPVLKDKVDDDSKEAWKEWGERLGQIAGFTAAGGHGLAGLLKIYSGQKQGNNSRKLDGLVDVATASVIAASVGGFGLARAVAAPIAAALNVFRGGYNAGDGFRKHDDRKQLQGVLDAVRSAGSFGRLLKGHHAVFNMMGIGLAPLAGAIQAGRGIYDLSIGLKNDDNKRELKGLVDIAMAVGTAMAFASGVAVIPGIALAVGANLTKVLYQVNPKFRSKIDAGLDKIEPKLKAAVNLAEKVSAPLRRGWKKLVGRFVKPEAPGPDEFSDAKMAEVLQLVHSDGDFDREEERRLRTVLEKVGEQDRLPKRDQPPPPTIRRALKAELPQPEDRINFLRFLLVVEDYDRTTSTREAAYLEDLARDLGVDPDRLEELRREREAEKLRLLGLAAQPGLGGPVAPESLGQMSPLDLPV